MDDTNDIRQLIKEKDNLRKKIIENLTELYFLRNNGQMYDFQVWSTHTKPKDRCISPIIDANDDDIKSDQKFSQLLNLKFEEPVLETKHSLNDSISPPQEKKVREESPIRDETPQTNKSHLIVNDVTPKEANDVQFVEQPSESKHLIINDRLSPPPATEKRPREESLDEKDELSSKTIKSSTTTTSTGKKSDHAADITSKETNDIQLSTEPNEPNNSFNNDSIKSPPEKRVRLESPVRKDEAIKSDQLTDAADTSKETSQTQSIEPEIIRIDKPSQSVTPKSYSKEDSPTRISKVVEPIVTPSAVNAENSQRLNAERVKHEAAVRARISELRKLGLWSSIRLPKCQEPPRPKTHWDYLLEEAKWLHNDYRLEKKWKRDAARRIAHAAYRCVNNKRTQEERIEREKVQHVRKIAASLSKEVRSFWSSIEKIVDFRQQTKLEETRKKAWGLHLNYILDQTSKFSNSYLEEQPQQQEQQQLANNQTEINYLINKGEDTEKKEPVINVSIFILHS